MQRLELTWIGKGNEPRVEPRILLHDPSKDYGDPNADNMLIHGDNLLALKALEQEFAGRVKCIYIDPPYNIDAMNEHYDDYIEHSRWLSKMMPRLGTLRNLLREDGSIWIQINDEEQAYLKVICDEVFGRNNFVNMISVNMKNNAGASGGGEDKKLKKNCEFILVYAKNYDMLPTFTGAYDYTEMHSVVEQYRTEGKNWHYTSVLVDEGEKRYVGSTADGDGNEIKVFARLNAIVKSVNQLIREEGITEKDVYYKYGHRIFEAKDAQSSIRTRVNEAKKLFSVSEDILSIEYVPKTGRNKGKLYEQFYKGEKCRLFAWLRDLSETIDGVLYKKDLQGTYWDFTSSINNLTKEGGVVFPNGKKPEALISRIFDMTTSEGDLVLDSFLGSGTTAAVAQKTGRRYIGIELGEHCYTHCLPRLKAVVDGEQGGISKAMNWLGGGGFKFYELAPTLIVKDSFGNPVFSDQYNPEMLVAAVAKLNGFLYSPDTEVFWKQGKAQGNSYIYITTQYFTAKELDEIAREVADFETLVICAPAFDIGLGRRYDNITVKKIPQSVLSRCEYGVNNYNLNIVDVSEFEEDENGEFETEC